MLRDFRPVALGSQAALLQFLDERRYRCLGDSGPERTADVRILVATVDGFRGLVLAAAIERLGSPARAFAALGQAGLMARRNHHRLLRREGRRLQVLLEGLGLMGLQRHVERLGPGTDREDEEK